MRSSCMLFTDLLSCKFAVSSTFNLVSVCRQRQAVRSEVGNADDLLLGPGPVNRCAQWVTCTGESSEGHPVHWRNSERPVSLWLHHIPQNKPLTVCIKQIPHTCSAVCNYSYLFGGWTWKSGDLLKGTAIMSMWTLFSHSNTFSFVFMVDITVTRDLFTPVTFQGQWNIDYAIKNVTPCQCFSLPPE